MILPDKLKEIAKIAIDIGFSARLGYDDASVATFESRSIRKLKVSYCTCSWYGSKPHTTKISYEEMRGFRIDESEKFLEEFEKALKLCKMLEDADENPDL